MCHAWIIYGTVDRSGGVKKSGRVSIFPQEAKIGALQSRGLIAKLFIYNCYLLEEEQAKKHPRWGSVEHSLVMGPRHKKNPRATGAL